MKGLLAATGACMLLAVQPVWAQQEQPRSTTPSQAETNPTSSPMADPHKDGGRPESHGGTVHAPQVNAVAPLPADMKPTVESLARNAVTAQQYGNLASKRHTSGAVHDLGDRMVLTNSRINRALAAAAPELGDVQIPGKERGTFDSLARDADATQLGVNVAQWVVQSYPQAISDLERLGQQGPFSDLVGSALPEMKSQFSEAQRILQSASMSPNRQPTSTGTVTDPKTKSD
ncbi:DUF4142 domain-containing protein [Microvirga yunnanensis]|uniref:DUF4142 domain-containing protein n=1 Tax=Microvirga yunnanensis TaxID=2953740 RepID=UPI0021C809AF|nr:DUF4142 domain-containing protein [Microvirga sp. HBU65207]